jgi:hypothetical protein
LYHASGYDALNRRPSPAAELSAESGTFWIELASPYDPARAQRWTLDALGNMTQVAADDDTPQTHTINSANQITAFSHSDNDAHATDYAHCAATT